MDRFEDRPDRLFQNVITITAFVVIIIGGGGKAKESRGKSLAGVASVREPGLLCGPSKHVESHLWGFLHFYGVAEEIRV